MTTTDPREKAIDAATASKRLSGGAARTAAARGQALALVDIADALRELTLAVRDGFVDAELDELDEQIGGPPTSDEQFTDPGFIGSRRTFVAGVDVIHAGIDDYRILCGAGASTDGAAFMAGNANTDPAMINCRTCIAMLYKSATTPIPTPDPPPVVHYAPFTEGTSAAVFTSHRPRAGETVTAIPGDVTCEGCHRMVSSDDGRPVIQTAELEDLRSRLRRTDRVLAAVLRTHHAGVDGPGYECKIPRSFLNDVDGYDVVVDEGSDDRHIIVTARRPA